MKVVVFLFISASILSSSFLYPFSFAPNNVTLAASRGGRIMHLESTYCLQARSGGYF